MIDDIKFYLKKCGAEALVNPALWALIYYRMGHYLLYSKYRKINPFWYLYLILNILFTMFFKIEMPASCKIGKCLFLPHAYGLVMGPDTIIGNNVTIGPWVVLGHNFDDKYPIIEDDCYIGPKASLLGGIRVGKGSKIGTNAVVTKDLPPNSQVVSLSRMISSSDYVD